jgi:hypothetical protein
MIRSDARTGGDRLDRAGHQGQYGKQREKVNGFYGGSF